MTKIFSIALLMISLMFVGCQEEAKTIVSSGDKYAFFNEDPIGVKRNERPMSLPLMIPSGDHSIAGRILMAKGKDAKPTVIFLHGNPGFEKNEETGQMLRRAGYNTVFCSYSGTWGNKGVFSYKQSIQDVKAIVAYLTKNSKQIRIDNQAIYLCGFSMGADIALLAGQELPQIKGIISIDPWNGHHSLKRKSEQELSTYIQNLEQRPCIQIESGKAFVDGITTNNGMDIKAPLKNYPNRMLHIFSKKKDMLAFKRFCDEINEKDILVLNACDHSFSDKRMALAQTLYDWLEKAK